MQAVGEVIRRRNSLRGIYGFKADHVDHEPAWVWDQARKAWRASATSNITKGADAFESTDFKTPYWARGLAPVSTVGKHRFFKLKG
jgi:spore germination cell wall hydrolase CwlJ-like protein